MVIVNFYNPCKRLELLAIENIEGQDRRQLMWCGDFNAHSPSWGGLQSYVNGQVLEESRSNVPTYSGKPSHNSRGYSSKGGTNSILMPMTLE